jgi:ERCC4-type nuclease
MPPEPAPALLLAPPDDGQQQQQQQEKTVACPFTVQIDTREQLPYTFSNLFANADKGHARLIVPTVRRVIEIGDYTIAGLETVVAIERKSKEDLYSSIGQRRENFVHRLQVLSDHRIFGAVIVEAGWDSLVGDPPHYSRLNPKALARTIFAWMVRYPRVQWVMMPDRMMAENATFRLLERFWAVHEGLAEPYTMPTPDGDPQL